MKSNHYRLIALIITLFLVSKTINLKAQINSELEEQAHLLFLYEEFEMARQLYDSLHQMDPYNPIYSQNLGDCFLKTSEPGKALEYYDRALAFSNNQGEIYYKIGNTYDLMNLPDSAIYYFKKFNSVSNKNKNAFNRIAIIYLDQENGQDSALVYAQKALSAEPENPVAYYTLSVVYIGLSRYEEAIYTALSGLKKDPDYVLLNMPAGLGYFHQNDYEKATEYFEKGWETPGLEEMFVNYLAFSKLLVNTEIEKFTKHNNDVKFNHINFLNIENIIISIQNPQSEYFYSNLLRNFRSDFQNFGLDDYAMFYLGFSTDLAYLPYEDSTMNMSELWNTKNYNLLKEYAKNRLDSVPVDFPLYWPLAKIAALEGDYLSQLDNLIKYYGFSQAITGTGDGNSTKSSFLITYIQHEYEIMYQLDLDVIEEHLESVRNNNFDVLLGENSKGETKNIYFNVDFPFSSIEKNFKNQKRKKKKRRNK
ncbi:MAG: DUF4919 domain-containing protein [Bacteroidales bacterium]|nr:DUF4919 domain-containing protein [Bacteroidales bacterium]